MDGRASAAVIARKEPDAEFRPIQWGMKPPEPVVGRHVYIVDVAFTIEDMRRIARSASELTWLDHHATCAPMAAELGFGTFDNQECGATLAWKHCFPNDEPPAVLPYIRDKDLWLWELPDSRQVSAALAERYVDDDFTGLLDIPLDRLKDEGHAALKRLHTRVNTIIRQGREIDEPYGLRGVRGLAINNVELVSEVGERIYLSEADGGLGYDIGICFGMRGDGRWVHSLRSTTVDCERIAAARGGGGHRNAASYVADEPIVGSADAW